MLCFHRDHQGHTTIPLIDYAKSCQVEILKGLEYISSKSKELDEAKKSVQAVIEEVNQVMWQWLAFCWHFTRFIWICQMKSKEWLKKHMLRWDLRKSELLKCSENIQSQRGNLGELWTCQPLLGKSLMEQLNAIEKLNSSLQLKSQEYLQVTESNNSFQISNTKREMDITIQVVTNTQVIDSVSNWRLLIWSWHHVRILTLFQHFSSSLLQSISTLGSIETAKVPTVSTSGSLSLSATLLLIQFPTSYQQHQKLHCWTTTQLFQVLQWWLQIFPRVRLFSLITWHIHIFSSGKFGKLQFIDSCSTISCDRMATFRFKLIQMEIGMERIKRWIFSKDISFIVWPQRRNSCDQK